LFLKLDLYILTVVNYILYSSSLFLLFVCTSVDMSMTVMISGCIVFLMLELKQMRAVCYIYI